MKVKNLLISFLTLVFGGTLLFNALAMAPPQNRTQSATDPTDAIQLAGKHFSMIKNNQFTGTVDPKDILEGEKALKNIKSGRTFGLNWNQRGPDNFAGRTKSVIVDNRDTSGKTLFVGSVAGGVWKSVTEGLTWNELNGSGINLNVSCMVQAANGDIYAGTGEDFTKGWGVPALIGRGIFKSSDGNSFNLLEATAPSGNEWNFINELGIDKSSSRIYAATNTGLKYSNDGGINWSFARTDLGVDLTGDASDVKVASDGTVVVSLNNQCWISQNGDANNFQSFSNDTITGLLPSTGVGRFEFAFAPSDPNVLYALAAVDSTRMNGLDTITLKGTLENIYKSTDKGSTWTVIGPGGSVNFRIFGRTNHGLYSNTISVFPNDPNRILAGGLTLWEGNQVLETGNYNWEQRLNGGEDVHATVFAPNNQNAIYLAGDFGIYVMAYDFQSGKSLNKTYVTSQFYSVAYSHNNDELIGGTQGYGPVYIDGKGNTPESANMLLTSFVGGYSEISQIDPKVFIYSSTKANLFRSNDKGATTSTTFLRATGMFNDSTLLTPFLLWESFNNIYSRDSITFRSNVDTVYNNSSIIVHSKNGQYPFNYTISGSFAVGDTLRIQDIVSSKFFVGLPGTIFMTKHLHDFTKEPDWDKIALISGVPMSMAYSKDANYLYVGTTRGNLYRISNIALAYDAAHADVSSPGCVIATSLIQTYDGRVVTSISVDPNNAAHILVTLGNYGNNDYVYDCTNALDESPTFISVQGNLPKIPVYTSLIEMNSSNRVLIGTDYGIYTTENLGNSSDWTQENTGMGEVPVMMIRQQTLDRAWSPGIDVTKNLGAIYIATNGRGLFENRSFVGITEHPEVTSNSTLKIYPNPANDYVKVSFKVPSTSSATLNIFDLSGQLIKTENLGRVKSGEVEYSLSTGNLGIGNYLIQIVTGNTRCSAKLVVVH
jgi:hypothetical protein